MQRFFSSRAENRTHVGIVRDILENRDTSRARNHIIDSKRSRALEACKRTTHNLISRQFAKLRDARQDNPAIGPFVLDALDDGAVMFKPALFDQNGNRAHPCIESALYHTTGLTDEQSLRIVTPESFPTTQLAVGHAGIRPQQAVGKILKLNDGHARTGFLRVSRRPSPDSLLANACLSQRMRR